MRKLLLALLLPITAWAADVGQLLHSNPGLVFECASGRPSRSSFTINETTDEIHWAFQAKKSATITTVSFIYGARTGTPPQYRVGIQAMSTTTNRGDGSYIQKEEFTPPADATWDGTKRTITLEASVSLTAGSWYAVVIVPVGTPDVSNNSSFYTRISNCVGLSDTYNVTVNTGTPTVNDGPPMFQMSTGTEEWGSPIKSGCFDAGGCTWTTGERGIKFTAPSGCSTASLMGFRYLGNPNGGGGTMTWRIYSGGGASDTTAAETTTVDTDNKKGTTAYATSYVYFDTPVTVTCGSAYRASIEIATNTMEVQGINVDANGDLAAFGPEQINWYQTTRNGGSWTDTTTARPLMFPIYADLTSSAGGGLLAPKNLSGGPQ